jgi:hypothetical protein
VVPIILDGENAWEHFPDGGRVFLGASTGARRRSRARGVYGRGGARLVAARELPRVHAGSWIGADFSVWIGHADDRRAWDALGDARDALAGAWEGASEDARRVALEAYRAACGSDWCWWYGDDRSSANDADFDRLFRRHLEVVYTAVGLAAPDACGARSAPWARSGRAGGAGGPGHAGRRRHRVAGRVGRAGLYAAPQAGRWPAAGTACARCASAWTRACLCVLVGLVRTPRRRSRARGGHGLWRARNAAYRVSVHAACAPSDCERRGPHGFEAHASAAHAAAGAVLEVAIPLAEVALGPTAAGFHCERLPVGRRDGAPSGRAPLQIRGGRVRRALHGRTRCGGGAAARQLQRAASVASVVALEGHGVGAPDAAYRVAR